MLLVRSFSHQLFRLLCFALLLFPLFTTAERPSSAASAATLAAVAPATVAPKILPPFVGTCTPSGEFCAHFAPTEIPVHVVAQYLRSAKSSIRIATYNMDVEEFHHILEEKLSQGVAVEFAVDFKLSYTTNVVWNSLRPRPGLVRYRLPVFRGANPQMHNKIIVIDNELVLFGSANFTYSGLVANYENILAVSKPEVVAQFNAELDELRANALVACRLFATPMAACGHGTESWDPRLHELLTTGRLPSDVVVSGSSSCSRLLKGAGGLLDERNLPFADLDACISDKDFKNKILALTQAIEGNERYADGNPTGSSDFKEKRHSRAGDFEVYFSPEDNIQRVILRELSRALDDPRNSFVLVSTNFITNIAIAHKLADLHKAGVYIEMFFDRGRYEDPSFGHALSILREIPITVFDNALTGPYGSNHNKMAIVGAGQNLALLNGSANWSSSAVKRNDENLTVSRDPSLVAIYAREIVSQLFVYRFAQNAGDPVLNNLLGFLGAKIPCLDALLGRSESCLTVQGRKWTPFVVSPILLSVEEVPASYKAEQVWVWVRQFEENYGIRAIPLFSDDHFAGRWLTSVPVPPNWSIEYKFFKVPKGYDPNTQGIPNEAWEYGPGPDRRVTAASFGVHVVREIYRWGRP